MLSAKEAKALAEENKVKIKLETEELVSKLVELLEEEIIDAVEEGKTRTELSRDRVMNEYPEAFKIMLKVYPYFEREAKYGYLLEVCSDVLYIRWE